MKVFSLTLTQMLVLFSFLAIGYIFNKKRIIPSDSYKMLSKLEAQLLLPCLIFNTYRKNCTVENFIAKSSYILCGALVIIISVILGEIVARIFSKEHFLRRVYSYSITISNFGFMGNALVLGVFGEEILFDFMMFTIPANLYAYSYGAASLMNKKKINLKSFINPVFISLVIGAICGLTKVPLPDFITSTTTSAGNCMAPLAMLLTGIISANYNFTDLIKDYKVYIMTFLRLVAMPVVFVLIFKAVGVDAGIVRAALCYLAMPLALNTVIFPAAYGGDTTPGASMALVSHLLSVVTIPILFMIFL